MQKISGLFSVLFLFFFITNFTSAQQWTAEQLDVWKGVQTYWDAGMMSDPSSMLSYFDESYIGWSYDNETPTAKSDATKALNYWFKKGKEQYHVITPAKIWVNGSFAYVHYYYTQVRERADGTPVSEKGRWTDILMKKDGKWMLVGDHGGEVDDD